MALVDVGLAAERGALPHDVRRFLREADRRIDRFQERVRVPAFVPSDYEAGYAVLRALADSPLLRGRQFCEWGSGFGVVASLAAMLGYESCGIEAEAELVHEARQLADDFSLVVEFAHGSFVPRGGEKQVYRGGEYAWLTTDADYAYDELGLDVDDMDVVFAYPWPDEEAVTETLFDKYAGPGAVLVTFHGGDEFRVRRKVAKKRRT